MASKPALFWTLRPHGYSGGFRVMRVTTEKPRRYYGTDEDGEPTHVIAALAKGPERCRQLVRFGNG